jgi:hypothetical protein
MSCVCEGEGRKRSQFVIGTPSEVSLGGKDVDLTNMIGNIKAPGGATEQCILKKMEDGKLGKHWSTDSDIYCYQH